MRGWDGISYGLIITNIHHYWCTIANSNHFQVDVLVVSQNYPSIWMLQNHDLLVPMITGYQPRSQGTFDMRVETMASGRDTPVARIKQNSLLRSLMILDEWYDNVDILQLSESLTHQLFMGVNIPPYPSYWVISQVISVQKAHIHPKVWLELWSNIHQIHLIWNCQGCQGATPPKPSRIATPACQWRVKKLELHEILGGNDQIS